MEAPSPHEGSKPRFTQHTDVAQDRPSRIARAQAWSESTGKPVPPHMRFRAPQRDITPLSSRQRLSRYAACNGDDAMFICVNNLLPPEGEKYAAGRLTPAQARRLRHKHGRREAEALLGYDPAQREAERVLKARRAARLRRAAAQLRRIVPRGPLDAVHGQALGRRRWRVVESAPSERAG